MKKIMSVLFCCIAVLAMHLPAFAEWADKDKQINVFLGIMPQRYAVLVEGYDVTDGLNPTSVSIWFRKARDLTADTKAPWPLAGKYYSASIYRGPGEEYDLLAGIPDDPPTVHLNSGTYGGTVLSLDGLGDIATGVTVTLAGLKACLGSFDSDVKAVPVKLRFYDKDNKSLAECTLIEYKVTVFKWGTMPATNMHFSFNEDTVEFGSPDELQLAIRQNIVKGRAKRYLLNQYYAQESHGFTDSILSEKTTVTGNFTGDNQTPATGVRGMACLGLMSYSLTQRLSGGDDYYDIVYDSLAPFTGNPTPNPYTNPRYCAYEAGIALSAISLLYTNPNEPVLTAVKAPSPRVPRAIDPPKIASSAWEYYYGGHSESLKLRADGIIENLKDWQKTPDNMELDPDKDNKLSGEDLVDLAATGGWRYYYPDHPSWKDHQRTADLSTTQWPVLGLWEAMAAKICKPTDDNVKPIITNLKYFAAAMQDQTTGGAFYACFNPSLLRRCGAQDGSWWQKVGEYTRTTSASGSCGSPELSFKRGEWSNKFASLDTYSLSSAYPIFGAMIGDDGTATNVQLTLPETLNADIYNDISYDPRKIPTLALAPTQDDWTATPLTITGIKGGAYYTDASGKIEKTPTAPSTWAYTFPSSYVYVEGKANGPFAGTCNWTFQEPIPWGKNVSGWPDGPYIFPVLDTSSDSDLDDAAPEGVFSERWILGTGSLLSILSVCDPATDPVISDDVLGKQKIAASKFLLNNYKNIYQTADPTNKFKRNVNLEDWDYWPEKSDKYTRYDLYGMFSCWKSLIMNNSLYNSAAAKRVTEQTWTDEMKIMNKVFADCLIGTNAEIKGTTARFHDSWGSEEYGTGVFGTSMGLMILPEYEIIIDPASVDDLLLTEAPAEKGPLAAAAKRYGK